MRWFPLALLIGSALAVAQNTPSTAVNPDAEKKKIHVEGTILSLNGEAVRKAAVRLQGIVAQTGQSPANYSESTDNEGKFVFEDVAPGRYTLSAEKTGFVTARYGARSNTLSGTQLNLVAGVELKSLSLKMTPQGVIAGRVTDQDGDPVAMTQVQAMRYGYQRGRRQLQQTGGVTTNDLGEYRIGNLAPGRYYISASDRRAGLTITSDRPGRPGAGQEGNVTTFYPNGTDASSAAPIDVAAGGELRGIDIRLRRAKVYAVRGKVASPSGITQALVALVKKEDSGNAASALIGGGVTQLRPDGGFEYRGIVPGAYVLQVVQATLNGNAPANVTGRVEVTVADANIDDLVLPMGPGPEITGTVKVEDGDIAALLKPAQNTPMGLTRFTILLNDTEGLPLNTPNAQVKDDGTFRFNAVGTSKYLLNANQLPQGTYLKSARFGGQDVTHAPIDTTSGAGGTLDLVLSSKPAEVAGSVRNDKSEALGGVMVTLWPKTPEVSPTGGARLGFTDQNGGFRFQGLAPGDYYVAAWEDLEPGLAQSPDFMSHFTSEASAVKLTEGAHESRDLKLVPADKLLAEIAKLP
jgi:protocatechuate 3,4-dioxygenase beta subunit